MNAVALLAALYVLPVLFAHFCHEAKGRPAPVVHPADPVDHNFDDMWEAASRR